MPTRQHAIEVEHQGQVIRGMVYLPDTTKRCPAVLLLHGWTGQRMESGFLFVRLGRELASRGVAAVTFDFRNSGESDGSFDRMLATQELSDAVRMTHWLAGQPFADRSRLGLLGFSMGGLLVPCTDARTNLYRAIVMLAPTSVTNFAKREADAVDGVYTVGPLVMTRDFFPDLKTLDPMGDAVRRTDRPALILHGTGDKAVPHAVSEQYADAMRRAGTPVTLELIQDADHAFSSPAWRGKLIPRVVEWFVNELA